MNEGLVYIGKIVKMEIIIGADFIVSATVICGQGGIWKGIIRKDQFEIGDLCIVYLPDALIPKCINMKFMEATNWRVRMRRFKGAPSEVVIMPHLDSGEIIGTDLTSHLGVTKYQKPIPVSLQGVMKGDFPSFIPKTDEPNYQVSDEWIDELVGKPWYMTEKADGSSTTAYRYKGEFGLCSRNLELMRDSNNGYWQVAEKYKVEEKLPDGFAIQWETCGPKIQGNPMGLTEIDGLMFSAYYITEHRYLTFKELRNFSYKIGFPMVKVIESGDYFSKEGLEKRGEGTYSNGKQREGVVIRSQENHGGKPISFKIINLAYEN